MYSPVWFSDDIPVLAQNKKKHVEIGAGWSLLPQHGSWCCGYLSNACDWFFVALGPAVILLHSFNARAAAAAAALMIRACCLLFPVCRLVFVVWCLVFSALPKRTGSSLCRCQKSA